MARNNIGFDSDIPRLYQLAAMRMRFVLDCTFGPVALSSPVAALRLLRLSCSYQRCGRCETRHPLIILFLHQFIIGKAWKIINLAVRYVLSQRFLIPSFNEKATSTGHGNLRSNATTSRELSSNRRYHLGSHGARNPIVPSLQTQRPDWQRRLRRHPRDKSRDSSIRSRFSERQLRSREAIEQHSK